MRKVNIFKAIKNILIDEKEQWKHISKYDKAWTALFVLGVVALVSFVLWG